MSCFICEKCGLIDNTDCNNNYWLAIGRKDIDKHIIEKIHVFYQNTDILKIM